MTAVPQLKAMTTFRCTLLATCLLGVLLGISRAKAQSESITFSGAVVAPTCSSSDARSVATASTPSGLPSAATQFVCLGAGATPDMARSYSQTENSLSAAQAAQNQLLEYFAGYTSAEHRAQAMLVVRTFT